MVKFVPQMTSVVLEEIPGRVSLALAISRCRGCCEGCHSPELRQDIGCFLTADKIDTLLEDNFGVDCVLFLGEGDDISSILRLADSVKSRHGLMVALYSGRIEVEEAVYQVFDYVKTGPYIKSLGPLSSPTTNQRLYRVTHSEGSYTREDITAAFRNRTLESRRSLSEG